MFLTSRKRLDRSVAHVKVLQISMSRLCYDVLRNVCEEFHPRDAVDRLQARQAGFTLVAVALVCKAFSAPALDVLWHTLASEKPLGALLLTLGILTQERVLGDGDEKPRGKLPQWVNRGTLCCFHRPPSTDDVSDI